MRTKGYMSLAAAFLSMALLASLGAGCASDDDDDGGGGGGLTPLPATTVSADNVGSLANYLQPGGSGWAGVSGRDFQTSSSTAGGGHGPFSSAELPSVNVKAVHDGTQLAMRFQWADSDMSTTRYSTWDGAQWNSGGNEDRMFVMWPITDAAGRAGLTFSQAGCAMTCHARQYDSGTLSYLSAPENNTTSPGYLARPLDDCGACHENSSNVAPGFGHPAVSGGASNTCGFCHTPSGQDRWGTVHTPDDMGGSADMLASGAGNFDVWHWKAQRSAPMNILEDQNIPPGARRTRDGMNVAPDNRVSGFGTAGYAGGNGGQPAFIRHNGGTHVDSGVIFESEVAAYLAALGGGQPGALASLPADIAVFDEATDTVGTYLTSTGATVTMTTNANTNRHVLLDNTSVGNASANTMANSSWAAGVWTVVVVRNLAAPAGEATKDYNFTVGTTHEFSFAVTDESGGEHKGVAIAELLINP